MGPGDHVCYVYPASVGRYEDLFGIVTNMRIEAGIEEFEVLWFLEEDRDMYDTWYIEEDLQLIRSINYTDYKG